MLLKKQTANVKAEDLKQIITKNVCTITPESTLTDLYLLIDRAAPCDHLFVVDSCGCLIGDLSMQKANRRMLPFVVGDNTHELLSNALCHMNSTTIETIMTPLPHHSHPDTLAEDLINTCTTHNIAQMPVTDNLGKLLYVIDINKALCVLGAQLKPYLL